VAIPVCTSLQPSPGAWKPTECVSDSGAVKGMARRVWPLHVGSLLVSIVALQVRDIACSSHFPIGSWEFVTGLHFEWDVIRRRQTYRWTIWVRDDEPLL